MTHGSAYELTELAERTQLGLTRPHPPQAGTRHVHHAEHLDSESGTALPSTYQPPLGEDIAAPLQQFESPETPLQVLARRAADLEHPDTRHTGLERRENDVDPVHTAKTGQRIGAVR